MVEINWPLLITQTATFLVAMIILWKFSWGPLTKMMNDRSGKIEDDIQRAEDGKREIEALEADYHRRLSDIETKARKEINEAIQKGQNMKEEILIEARQEAQRVMEKNQQMIAQEREHVIQELRQHVTDISLKAMEKVIGEQSQKEVHVQLMNKFLDDLEKVEESK